MGRRSANSKQEHCRNLRATVSHCLLNLSVGISITPSCTIWLKFPAKISAGLSGCWIRCISIRGQLVLHVNTRPICSITCRVILQVNNTAIACVLHAERVILQLHSKTFWDGEDDEELTNDKVDIVVQATGLAMDGDAEMDTMNEGSDEDSEVQSESESEGGGSDSDYVPNMVRGRCRRRRTAITKDMEGEGTEPDKTVKDTTKEHTSRRGPLYEFCPLPVNRRQKEGIYESNSRSRLRISHRDPWSVYS